MRGCCGIVFRVLEQSTDDSNGQVVVAMSRPYPSCFKPKVMEALALVFSLISHVFQSANTFAHALAKYALSVDKECVWLEKFPPPLMTIVL
uniref:RNase H type-1 domain-containing protein n=1 Tax=Cannabis sativa TaxID=3483 RepID=A0A803PRI4_CANSA